MMLFRYWLELLQLLLGMYVCFDAHIRYPWRQIGGAVFCVPMFFLLGQIDFPATVASYLIAGGVAFWCLERRGRKEFSQLLLLFVLVAGMEEMIDGPRSLYQVMKGLEVQETVPLAIINWLIRGLILVLIWVIRKKMSSGTGEKIFGFIRKNLLWMLAVVIWHMALSIGISGYAVKYIPGARAKFYCFLLDFFGFFSILLFAAVVLYMWAMYRQLRLEQERKEAYYRAEKFHYEMLLKNEKATRKFRHDMRNHLICMERLAREQSWDRLQEYLSGMVDGSQNIFHSYETGNQILDIITNYMVSALDEKVKIVLTGTAVNAQKIRPDDLCAIYANLLQNAVEELQRRKAGEEAALLITFSENEHLMNMEIENSLSGSKTDLATSKEDKELHGFGMVNVRETVEKNHGKLQVEIRRDSFYVSVMLPI